MSWSLYYRYIYVYINIYYVCMYIRMYIIPLYTCKQHLNGGSVELELIAQLSNDFPGVGTHTVHFVDEGNAWHLVPLHLAVNGVGL